MNKILCLCLINFLSTASLMLYGMEHVSTIPSEINKLDAEGNSALYYAVANNNDKIAEYLLHQQADPNINGPIFSKNTPLILAVDKQSLQFVLLLLNHKADINTADKDGNTPLHHAVKASIVYNDSCITDILTILLEDKKINKDLFNTNEKATALHLAAKADRFDLVQKLLPIEPSHNNTGENSIPNNDENHFYE